MKSLGVARFGALIAGITRRARIGGDGPPWLDPETLPEDLPQYIEMHPEALENPNMPTWQLVGMAQFWPEYVENNPHLFMLSLEDPTLYEEIQSNLSAGWASDDQQRKLSTRNQRALGMQFVKRLLPRWKEVSAAVLSKVNQKLFESALEEAYRVFLGKTDFTTYEKLRNAVQVLRDKIDEKYNNNASTMTGQRAWKEDADVFFVLHALKALHFAIAGMGPSTQITVASHAAEEVCKAIRCFALDAGKSFLEALEASNKEVDYQAKEVRRVFLEEETYKEVIRQLGNKFREEFYGSELPKKKKTSKDYLKEYERDQAEHRFIEQNKQAAKQIARKIAETRGAGWPAYLLLGVVAGSIAIVIAGELLVTAAVVEGGALAADAIAGEVAAYAAAADISTVSVEQLLTAAEMNEVEAQLFYKALKDKLLSKGLDVVKDVAAAVVQVTR